MSTEITPKWGWRAKATLWTVCLGAAVVFLGFRLHERANPWEMALVIPSDYDERDDADPWISHPSLRRGDLSADGRMLAVGRPNGTCEIWDMATLRRIHVVGEALPPEDGDRPTGGGACQVRMFPDGRHVAVYREDLWQVYDVNGACVPLGTDRGWQGYAAVSPMGLQIATCTHGRVSVIDVKTRQAKYEWELDHWSGGRRRLDWTPDGRYLLMNDAIGVRVWDVRRGELLFLHRWLDLRLPPPMIADEHWRDRFPLQEEPRELPEDLKHLRGTRMEKMACRSTPTVAYLEDSQFSPDGSYFATLYAPHAFFGWADPGTRRLRFYETTTGKLLWDHVLSGHGRSMSFSPDGSLLYVFLGKYLPETLQVFDTVSRCLLRDVRFPFKDIYPREFTPFPDNRWIASFG